MLALKIIATVLQGFLAIIGLSGAFVAKHEQAKAFAYLLITASAVAIFTLWITAG